MSYPYLLFTKLEPRSGQVRKFQPPPQALRFSHGRSERETRVTGDDPQGTMGRVPSHLPLRAHFHRKRDVWVRGRENSIFFADWLDCERVTLALSFVRALWRVQFISCKVFGSIQINIFPKGLVFLLNITRKTVFISSLSFLSHRYQN